MGSRPGRKWWAGLRGAGGEGPGGGMAARVKPSQRALAPHARQTVVPTYKLPRHVERLPVAHVLAWVVAATQLTVEQVLTRPYLVRRQLLPAIKQEPRAARKRREVLLRQSPSYELTGRARGHSCPAHGLPFAAHRLRHRPVSSNEAARSHPFISGIAAPGSRRFRPHPAAVEPRFEGIEFDTSTRWAVAVPSGVEDRVAVELHAELRGAQIDAERVSFDIHTDFSSRAKCFCPLPTGPTADN
jgi:hypothetical protein